MMQCNRIKKYRIEVSLKELYVAANKAPPMTAGETSRIQVSMSLGFIPDQTNTMPNMRIQRILIIQVS